MTISKIVFSPRHVAGCDVRSDHGGDLIATGDSQLYKILVLHRAVPSEFQNYAGDILIRPRFMVRGEIELVLEPRSRTAFFRDCTDTMQGYRYWTQTLRNNSIKISEAGSHFALLRK